MSKRKLSESENLTQLVDLLARCTPVRKQEKSASTPAFLATASQKESLLEAQYQELARRGQLICLLSENVRRLERNVAELSQQNQLLRGVVAQQTFQKQDAEEKTGITAPAAPTATLIATQSRAFTTASTRQPRYWTSDEHERFLQAVAIFGPKAVKEISFYVGTRTTTQVRTHSQKYFKRVRTCVSPVVPTTPINTASSNSNNSAQSSQTDTSSLELLMSALKEIGQNPTAEIEACSGSSSSNNIHEHKSDPVGNTSESSSAPSSAPSSDDDQKSDSDNDSEKASGTPACRDDTSCAMKMG